MIAFRTVMAALLACVLGSTAARAEESDEKAWVEQGVTLPDFPVDQELLEFYVSAATSNRFFIDAKTLSVGDDRVVRYTLVVRTSGGATNISYEGIRCSAREYKLYSVGRSDGTWSGLRDSEWRAIENKPINRHHAALSRDLFCPGRVAIFSADEGRNALRLGKHPHAD